MEIVSQRAVFTWKEEELGLTKVEFEVVGRHPVSDVFEACRDACLDLGV